MIRRMRACDEPKLSCYISLAAFYLGGKATYLEKQRDKLPFIVGMQVLHRITVSRPARSTCGKWSILPVQTIASKVLEVSPALLTGEGYRPKRDRRNRKNPYRRVKGRY